MLTTSQCVNRLMMFSNQTPLRSHFYRLQEWAVDNHMKLNPTKCHAMTVCFKRARIDPPVLMIGDSVINQSNCIKILGVNVQSNLKWDTHVDSMCCSFNRRLFFLRQLKRSCVPIDDLVRVYVQYVRPAVEYACPVWHPRLTKIQNECLEKLQKRAFCIILSIDLSSHTSYRSTLSTLKLPIW